MSIEEHINEMIRGLSKEKHETLQHIFIQLVQVIANDKLEGFFMHTLPSPEDNEDNELEGVLVHGVNCDGNDIERLMCNFMAARNAQAAAATNTDPTRTH